MKESIILIITLLLTLPIFSQIEGETNHWAKENLNGEVESMKYLKYEVNYLNDSIYEMEIEDFIAPSNYIFFFDQKGKTTKKIELRLENDNLIEKGVWNYLYENGKIKKDIYYWNNRSKDSTTWVYEYPDDKTQLITKKQFSVSEFSPQINYYSYKKKRNHKHYEASNSDSSYVERNLIVYDAYDRVIRVEKYEDKDYLMDITFNSYKDSTAIKPYQTVSSFTKYDEPRPGIIRYKYNENNDPIEILNLSFPDEERRTIIEYEYDSKGNWTKKTEKSPTGKVFQIYKREFTYY